MTEENQDVKLEYKEIEPDKLEIVNYNPNEMTPETELQLKNTIITRGFMDPLTVIPHGLEPDKYIVSNGAHRLKIWNKIYPGKKIPSIVVYGKTEKDIKIDLVVLNRIHGEFNNTKFAKLLSDIENENDKDTINTMLAITDAERKQIEKLAHQETEEYQRLKAQKESEKNQMKIAMTREVECPKCKHVFKIDKK